MRCLDRLPRGRRRLLSILTYHRIDEVDARPDLDPSLISATPDQFERQVQWLARDFDLVSLDDVLAAVAGDAPLPSRAVLLTFDDAYLDFEYAAWPILKARNAAATMFVPTGYPDQPQRSFWWDRLYGAIVRSGYGGLLTTPFGPIDLADSAGRQAAFGALKQHMKSLPESEIGRLVDTICEQCGATPPAPAVLSSDQLKQLASEGVALAPHTHTHPLLDRISPDEARREIRQSCEWLRQTVGAAKPAFAYPSGQYNSEVAAIVREEGLHIAFTTVRGVNDLESADPFTLRRNNVGRQTPEMLIRFQLTAAARHLNKPLSAT